MGCALRCRLVAVDELEIFFVGPRPDGIPDGEPRQCHQNAAAVAAKYGYQPARGWGWRRDDVWIPHFFNVYRPGYAIDTTWGVHGQPLIGERIDPELLAWQLEDGNPFTLMPAPPDAALVERLDLLLRETLANDPACMARLFRPDLHPLP